MNRFLALLSFFILYGLNAKPPIIDYSLIHAWCAELPGDRKELACLKDYLTLCKEWAQDCLEDPQFSHSTQGQKLQEAIQKSIAALMTYGSLKITYGKLISVVKQELSLNTRDSFKSRKKRMYKVLAMVYNGFLNCVQARLDS